MPGQRQAWGQRGGGSHPGTWTGLSGCSWVQGHASDTPIWTQAAQGLGAGRTCFSAAGPVGAPDAGVCSSPILGTHASRLPGAALPPPSANTGIGPRGGFSPPSSRRLDDPGPRTLTGSWARRTRHSSCGQAWQSVTPLGLPAIPPLWGLSRRVGGSGSRAVVRHWGHRTAWAPLGTEPSHRALSLRSPAVAGAACILPARERRRAHVGMTDGGVWSPPAPAREGLPEAGENRRRARATRPRCPSRPRLFRGGEEPRDRSWGGEQGLKLRPEVTAPPTVLSGTPSAPELECGPASRALSGEGPSLCFPRERDEAGRRTRSALRAGLPGRDGKDPVTATRVAFMGAPDTS